MPFLSEVIRARQACPSQKLGTPLRECSPAAQALHRLLRRAAGNGLRACLGVRKIAARLWGAVCFRHARRLYAAAMAELEAAGLVRRVFTFGRGGWQGWNVFWLAPNRSESYGKTPARKASVSLPDPESDPDPDLPTCLDLPSNSALRGFEAKPADGPPDPGQKTGASEGDAREGAKRPPRSRWRTFGDVGVGPLPGTASGRVFEAYALARGGTWEPHSAWAHERVRVGLARFVARVGEALATEAVEAFARAADPWLVEHAHPIALFLKQWRFATAAGGGLIPARWTFANVRAWNKRNGVNA